MSETPAWMKSSVEQPPAPEIDTTVPQTARIWNQSANPTYTVRSPEQIAGYFEGLELVEPGVGPLAQWRPDPDAGPPEGVDGYGGLGRKP